MRGAFDFETFEWVNPFCCGFAWGEEREVIIDPARLRTERTITARLEATRYRPDTLAEDALIFMHEQQDVTEWWAHNMGKFDGLLLCAAAQRLGWSVSAQLASSRVISFSFRPPNSKRAVRCFDSYALAPSSLRSCAEDFDLPSRKLFSEDDYTVDPRTWPLKKLKVGCLTDCVLILELLTKLEGLITEWGGAMKHTFSGSALSVVKADLEARGLSIPDHDALDLRWMNVAARQGYYGARVEVLHHRPAHALTEWDVCSSYPWAMSQRLPWHPLGQATGRGFERMLSGDFEGMIQARVTVPEMEFPPLPFKLEGKGSVYFPTGTWDAWFTAVELRYAISLGCTVHPLDGLLYEPESPFGPFVDKVYGLKATAEGAVRTFAKLTLNGCYGRFGMKPERENLVMFASDEEGLNYAAERPGRCEPIGDDFRALAVETIRWAPTTHFAVAAYITALARMKLHAAMRMSDELAYVDSDSIHALRLVTSPMKHPNEPFDFLEPRFGNGLGEWKVELPKYRGEFFAPKIYRLTCAAPHKGCQGVHLAAKGFPVEEEAFARLISQQRVEVERMRLLKSQLRSGDRKMARVAEAKAWHGLSTKRRPHADGSTSPWSVSDLRRGKHLAAYSPLAGAAPFPSEDLPDIPSSGKGHRNGSLR